MRFSSLVSAATFVASASAHATWQQLWINGVDAGSSCARLATSNNPIGTQASNLACNTYSNSANVCSVQPGDKVTVEMHQQGGQRQCSSEAIGGQHYGPVMVYMGAVSDAKTANPSSVGWFKVSELGLVSNNPDYFAVQVLNDNCGHYTFTVPDVAPGDYLLRAEVIALHVAGSSGGAQHYPGCFQIKVGGNGSAKPPTVKFPGAYSNSDPGILVNIHASLATYKIPGPTPYAYSAPAMVTTAWKAAATWNTQLQPSNVPTTTPAPGATGIGSA